MKCIILAAGYATRLYPLTENFPKPLLPVAGKPILDWLLDDIENSGLIEEYIVVSNNKFVGHFQNWALNKNYKIRILDDGTQSNETRLGAVMDIMFAIETLKLHDDLLVIAGDNLLSFSLSSFINYAKTKGTSCVMRYSEPDKAKIVKCGVLQINEDDLVLSMEEKPKEPKSTWCCPPFYFYTKEDANRINDAIKEGCGTDAPGSFVAWLAAKAPVHAMEMPGRRFDVGTLETYETIKKNYTGINEVNE